MKVAMLSVHASPISPPGGQTDGGMNVYVKELATELGKIGVDVDIFVRRQTPVQPPIVLLNDRARVIHISGGPSRPMAKNRTWEYLPEFTERTLEFMAGEDSSYSLIHGHYWFSGWVALHLRDALGVPVVHNYHSLAIPKEISLLDYGNGEREEEHPLRKDIEKLIMESADRLVATSHIDRELIREYYDPPAHKVERIACGVDRTLFRPGSKDQAKEELGLDGRKTALFVGRIKPVKGLVTLIEAIGILLEKDAGGLRDSFRVLIVGGEYDLHKRNGNGEMKRIRSAIERLGVGEHVRFAGPIAHDRLPAYYRASDLCVVPSRYESFCLVALEAMACGTPVVGSPVGELPCLVDDGLNGFLVPKGDPGTLADRMSLLLGDEKLSGEMGECAAAGTRMFGWPRIAGEMLEMYLEVVAVSGIFGREDDGKIACCCCPS